MRLLFLPKRDNGMIVYTLVRPEIREYIKEAAEKAEIVAYDIIGPSHRSYPDTLRKNPFTEPGLNS